MKRLDYVRPEAEQFLILLREPSMLINSPYGANWGAQRGAPGGFDEFDDEESNF